MRATAIWTDVGGVVSRARYREHDLEVRQIIGTGTRRGDWYGYVDGRAIVKGAARMAEAKELLIDWIEAMIASGARYPIAAPTRTEMTVVSHRRFKRRR
jgi:hypothetical protein